MARMDESTRKRLRPGRLMLAGKTPSEAAPAVGVARQTEYTCKARLDAGGIDARRAMGKGRPAQLDSGQLDGLRIARLQAALAHGCGTCRGTAFPSGMRFPPGAASPKPPTRKGQSA
jgi:hypothetical protein